MGDSLTELNLLLSKKDSLQAGSIEADRVRLSQAVQRAENEGRRIIAIPRGRSRLCGPDDFRAQRRLRLPKTKARKPFPGQIITLAYGEFSGRQSMALTRSMIAVIRTLSNGPWQ